jgi:steroid delta-isomerase-like uncharacterized protein
MIAQATVAPALQFAARRATIATELTGDLTSGSARQTRQDEERRAATMTAHGTERMLVERWFAGMDRADTGTLDEICTDDYALHFPGVPAPLDRATAKGLLAGFFAGFPGIDHTIEEIIVDDDRAAVRITVRGIHTGEFNGIPPTGKEVSFAAVNLMRFRDGKIAEQRVFFDSTSFLRQLGIAG